MSNPLLEAALEYASRGWPVLPVRVQEKAPLIQDWPRRATVDPEIITSWWTRWPKARIGLLTGVAFDAIDCDSDEACNDVLALTGATLQGPIAKTRRGWHLYVLPTGQGNRVAMMPGVDYRGRDGYVIAPPSSHEEGAYAWEVGPETPPEPLPEPLAALLLQPERKPAAEDRPAPMVVSHAPSSATSYGAKALQNLTRQVAAAREGERNNALNRSAFSIGHLIAGGEVSEAEAVEALSRAALAAGLSQQETERTIQSGIEAGKKTPRKAPALKTKETVEKVQKAGRTASPPGDVALLEVAHAHAGIFRSLSPRVPVPPLKAAWSSNDGRQQVSFTGPEQLGVIDQSVFLALLSLASDGTRRTPASLSTSEALATGAEVSARTAVEVRTSLREIAALIGGGCGGAELRRIRESLDRLRSVLVSWIEDDGTMTRWVSSALLAHGVLNRDGAVIVGVDPLLSAAAAKDASRVRIELAELRTLTTAGGAGRDAARILLLRVSAIVPPGAQRTLPMAELADCVYGPSPHGHSRERLAQVASGAAQISTLPGWSAKVDRQGRRAWFSRSESRTAPHR